MAIVYDPSGKIRQYLELNNISGDFSSRVLSQIDLFSTIVSMYNLKPTHLLGVDMFTDNKSFAFDSKGLDVITDSYFYNLKDNSYEIYDGKTYDEMILELEYIKNLKLSNDYYISQLIRD